VAILIAATQGEYQFMELWLVLILSGIFVYWVVSRNVNQTKTTHFWLLWLILMGPPLFTVGSVLLTKRPPALGWTVLSWVVSAVLYWRLIAKQPTTTPNSQDLPPATPSEESPPQPSEEATPLRPIDSEEEALLRQCFPWSTYFLEKIEYRPQAVVCRGKLRLDAEQAYQTVKENVAKHFGDRFFVLFQSGLNNQPFFALVPNTLNTISQQRPVLINYLLAMGSWILAWLTTSQIGALLSGLSMSELRSQGGLASQGWPYALTLLAILGMKDVSRYLIARLYHITTGLLYFIPLPFFPGTCGAFLQLRAPIPHRRALFDLGFASSLFSLSIALPALVWGLQHSTVVSLTEQSGILNFDSFNPRFSLLLAGISKVAMGKDFGADTAIDLHPVAIAAYLGFLITAINMLPFKRFDGGYIVHAMFGLRGTIIIGQVTKVLLVILGFIQYRASDQNGLLIAACLLTLFPTTADPTLNDVSELNSGRDWLGMLFLAMLVAIFLPSTGAISNLLRV
jgi:hypothetical protein